MKVSKVRIQNYRCINELTLDLYDSLALVGPNSVGKSCILSAISRVLSDTFYSFSKIIRGDFHKENISNPIKIYVTFSDLTEAERDYFHAISRSYCRIRGSLPKSYKRDGNSGPWISNISENLSVCLEIPYEENITFYFVGDDYQPIRYGNKTDAMPIAVKREDKKYFPKSLFIPSIRDSARFFSGTSRSVWGSLLSELRTKIENDSTILTPFTEAITALKASSHFVELSTKLQQQILSFLTEDHSSVNASILPVNPGDILKEASLFLNDGFDCALDLKGDGIKSLAVVAVLTLASSEGHFVICFEEPELYLHPTALFVLNKTIQKKDSSQIVYATHSPFLINVTKPKNIIRVYKDRGESKIIQLNRISHWLTREGELEIERDIDAQRNMIFFARGVILVEGPTENLALPYFAKVMNVDLDKKGIILIEVNGKGNLKRYSEYLNEFKIPHIVVYDSDSPIDPLSEIIQTEIPEAIAMNDNFEIMILSELGETRTNALLLEAYGDMYSKYRNHHLIRNKNEKDKISGFLIKNKPFSARYIAETARTEEDVPDSIKKILQAASTLIH